MAAVLAVPLLVLPTRLNFFAMLGLAEATAGLLEPVAEVAEAVVEERAVTAEGAA